MFLTLSVCLSVCLSTLSLFLAISLFRSLWLSHSVSLSLCLCLSLRVSLCFSVSLSVSLCVSVCLSVCLSLSVFVFYYFYFTFVSPFVLALTLWFSLSLSLAGSHSLCLIHFLGLVLTLFPPQNTQKTTTNHIATFYIGPPAYKMAYLSEDLKQLLWIMWISKAFNLRNDSGISSGSRLMAWSRLMNKPFWSSYKNSFLDCVFV